MEQKEIYLLIVSVSITTFFLSVSIVTLLVMFQKRRNFYKKELSKVNIEIKEQTLKNISWEIHDNIGQILSTINLYCYKIHDSSPEDMKPKVEEMQSLIQTAISEVRNLSKTLNTDYIKNIGLIKSTQSELERFERLNFLTTNFNVHGEAFELADDDEVILLRILQEFFSNTIKHAKASQLDVDFYFEDNTLTIRLKDDGVGFGDDSIRGTGLINMKNRAKLLGAFLTLDSEFGLGTSLQIIYKQKKTDHDE